MQFLFFDGAGARLFDRDDAERAVWTVEEYRLELVFPFVPGKAAARGMRVAFADEEGDMQFFEVRRAATRENGEESLVAEHIALAELRDEHCPRQALAGLTAAQALAAVLAGTRWSVGVNTGGSGAASFEMPLGSVWDAVLAIEEGWGVRVTPRVSVSAAGIAGRYLDISPAQAVWRGLRLSIDRNADELGVTCDDTDTLTALYGYGASENGVPLTFAQEVWTVAGGDATDKPAGQAWVEDAAATAAYGRNGKPRFGCYQNSSITDASALLAATWEALQATSQPRVTIRARVADLRRLGYAGEPMRLHDTALVEIRPAGAKAPLEIVGLEVDLLDSTKTRPTIGSAAQGMAHIARLNAIQAKGRGGGGSRGQSGSQAALSQFATEIRRNQYQISLRAYQRDMDDAASILRQAGLSLNAQGVLVYADDNVNMWQAKLNVQAGRIGLVVNGTGANASVNAAAIVAAVNASGSSVTISADKITLSGQTTVSDLLTGNAIASWLRAAQLDANSLYATNLSAESMTFGAGGESVSWQSKEVVTNVTTSTDSDPVIGTVVIGMTPVKESIYYLGRANA